MGKTLDIVPATSLDYRKLAEKRLPRFLFDYVDGGANDELTMTANGDDFGKIRLKQRVLRDVSHTDTSTTLFAEKVSMPMVLAPIGLAGMMARRGEAQAVRVANEVGVPFTLSTVGMRGRVMALFTMAFLGISPLGSLLGGWIAHRVGPRDTLLGCAFVMFLVGVVFFRTWSSTIDPTDQR